MTSEIANLINLLLTGIIILITVGFLIGIRYMFIETKKQMDGDAAIFRSINNCGSIEEWLSYQKAVEESIWKKYKKDYADRMINGSLTGALIKKAEELLRHENNKQI